MNSKTDGKFRLPKWHAATKRWRMRIGFHFDRSGLRAERPFYWPRPDDNGGVAPPDVIAEAVDHQKAWRKTKVERAIPVEVEVVLPRGRSARGRS